MVKKFGFFGETMKDIKTSLIELLEENARYSYKELSAIVGIDEKDVERAVKELEQEGVIVKYSAIVNTEKMKKNVEALIEVKVLPQKLKGFDSYAEQIYSFKEVKTLYLMSGGFDLAIFVEGKDIGEIARFISEKLSVIDGISGVSTHFILKKYKIEGQITSKNEESERQIIQA